jgi:3-oxoadipate enol-lactonase
MTRYKGEAGMDVIMPKLGMTMTSGKVVRWNKQNGELVRTGEPICEVETDKLNNEIEAGATGILTIIAQEGEELGVGAILGTIAVTEGGEQAVSTSSASAEGGALEKITANGITLAVQRSGSGYPLVLLHGLASSMSLWAALEQSQLADIEVISYDLRGHGVSDKPVGAHTIAKHVGDLKGLLTALNIQRAVLAGHSLGGMVAMELAASTPTMVAGLALLDTTATFPQETRNLFFEMASSASFNGMGAIVDQLLKLSFTPQFMEANPKIVATIRKGMLACDAASIAAAARMVAKVDLRPRLAAIQCPTVIIVGEQDELTPPSLAQELAEGIAGSTFHMLPASAHATPVEQAGAVTQLLAELVQAVREKQT